MPDVIPEKVTLHGRDTGEVVRIYPYFVKPVRLFRGVEVALSTPPTHGPPNFHPNAEEEIEFDRTYPPRRLKRFAAVLAKKFDLKPNVLRVRSRRGSYSLFIHLWEGAGTKADYKKLRTVMKYIEKNARGF